MNAHSLIYEKYNHAILEHNFKYLYSIQLFVACCACILLSHDSKAQVISVHGNFSASTEFYNFSSADSTLQPRRPDFNYRLSFNPIIQFGDQFAIPLQFEVTKKFKEAYLPLPPNENLIRTFANPNNAVGIHPTFKWAKFHIGSHTAEFSELSTGNLPIFGAGVDLQPGRFRIAYSYGISQWAIRPDTILRIDGTYERRFQAAKIGYGKKEGSGIYLNAVKIIDVEGDLDSQLPSVTAKEGVLASVDFRLKLFRNFTFTGEAGASGFTNDQQSEEVDENWLADIPESIFNPRRSTQLDYAGKTSLDLNYEKWGVSLQAKYLGAGYESLGFAFLETDILDVTLVPRFQLFKDRVLVHASVGQREDNLSNTKITTTKRFIGSGSLTAMISQRFTVAANYSNYGTRNTLDNDTLRLEFVAQNISVSPSYRFPIGKAANTLSVSFASSQFDDKNLFTGERNSNDMTAITGNWTAVIDKLTITGVGSVSHNKRSTGTIDIQMWSIQPGITLFKRKVQASCGFVYSIIELTGSTADTRIMLRPNVTWRITKRLQFRANGSLTTYQYGSARHNSQYNESYLQTSILQSF